MAEVLFVVLLFVLAYLLYTLIPKHPRPLPPDEVVDWRTTDEVDAYIAHDLYGEQRKVVVHISFVKQTNIKDQATILLRTKLAVQRAINEYYLSNPDISYSDLDATLYASVLPLAQVEQIEIYVRTVDIQ